MLSNDALSASCSTQSPPSPHCHYVIISSTPSLPLSSPFTEQAHNKTHSVTLCVFTPSLLAPDETPMLPQLAPVCRICDAWGGVWPAFWLSDLSCCGEGGNGAALSRSAGGGIRGSGYRGQAAKGWGFPLCLASHPEEKKNELNIRDRQLYSHLYKKTRNNMQSGGLLSLVLFVCFFQGAFADAAGKSR